jgi:hypothetical protein
VLIRAIHLGELTEAEAADRRAQPAAAASHWHVLRIADEVVDRARQPFPGEPIRTLDAIHVASTLVARSAVTGLNLLSLDERVRNAARKLGVEVLPSGLLPSEIGAVPRALARHDRDSGTTDIASIRNIPK